MTTEPRIMYRVTHDWLFRIEAFEVERVTEKTVMYVSDTGHPVRNNLRSYDTSWFDDINEARSFLIAKIEAKQAQLQKQLTKLCEYRIGLEGTPKMVSRSAVRRGEAKECVM